MNSQLRDIGQDGSDPCVQTYMRFNADIGIGYVVFSNVNAEDNE
jgi:alpha-glucuronidase